MIAAITPFGPGSVSAALTSRAARSAHAIIRFWKVLK
jgi:hypothetical protein